MPDPRTYIRVHDGMPDHPKVDPLSDKAFRLLVGCWCWSSRHLTDGAMPAAAWRKRGTAKARKELIAAGLVEETPDGMRFHDYLEHQRSAKEVEEFRAAKGKGGSIGNHVRWHVDRGLVDLDCPHCPTPPTDDDGDPDPIANGSHDRSHMRSADGSRNGNSEPGKRPLSSQTERDSKTPHQRDSNALTSEMGITGVANGSHMRSQTDRKTSPETKTETDVSGGSVGESSSVVDARKSDDDRDSKIDHQIVAQLAKLTGQTVTLEWAAHVRANILTGRDPRDPAAYVAAAIRGGPHDHLPTDGHPSNRTLAEALARGQCDHGDPRGPAVCPLCRRGIPQEES